MWTKRRYVYMSAQEEEHKSLETRWYVMLHRNPQWIETMLEKEQKGELLNPLQQSLGLQPEPFEYYVPYLYMRPDVSDEIRRIFHHFVFVRASEKRIQELVASDWNTLTRRRLVHYSSKSGSQITISDQELQQLRDIIYNSQLKIFFGVPTAAVREMAVGSRVLLRIKNWENHPGIIERIRLRKDGVSIRVSFNILGRTKSVTFDDLHDGDITYADDNTQRLISGNLIRNFEHEVALVLGHWFGKTPAEKKLQYAVRLRRLYAYSDIQIDEDDDLRQFTSLMLICATLLSQTEASEQYRTQLWQWLIHGNTTDPNTSGSQIVAYDDPDRIATMTYTDAYMMLALFVSTRNPHLRDAVKAYRKQHPDCPEILGTLINKVRDIRTTKPPMPAKC